MILFLKMVSFSRTSRLGISKSGLRLLLILCSVCGFAFSTHGQIVLLNSGYDVLGLANVSILNGSVTGRIASLNNLSFKNSSVDHVPNDSLPALYANRNLTVKNASIAQGDLLYGETLDFKNASLSAGYNSYQVSSAHQSPFSVNTVRQHFVELSNGLSSLQQNGTSNYQSWGRLDLNGNQGINVFNVSLSDYGNLSQIGISAPSGSTVIVNIFGQNFQGIAPYLTGVDASHVLFNFVDATSLDLRNGSFSGTYLAPYASISLSSGLNGQLIGNEIDLKNFSLTSNPFSGSLPSAIPEPSFYAGLMGLSGLGFLLYRRRKRKRNGPSQFLQSERDFK